MADNLVCGKWQLKESENFEDFMKALGVGYMVRKLGNQSKPLLTINKDNDSYSMKSESLVKTSEFSFKLNEQFDELSADGRKMKSLMTMIAPNTMKHLMLGTEGGKDSFCVREFMEDQMKCVCQVDDVVTTRMYARI